jgi:hypothetical protein
VCIRAHTDSQVCIVLCVCELCFCKVTTDGKGQFQLIGLDTPIAKIVVTVRIVVIIVMTVIVVIVGILVIVVIEVVVVVVIYDSPEKVEDSLSSLGFIQRMKR